MDVLGVFFSTFLGLLVDTVRLAIPLLTLTLIGVFAFNFIQHRTQMKWIGSAVLTLFGLFTLALFLLHAWNILNGVLDTNVNQIPPDVREQSEFSVAQANPFFLLGGALVQSIVTGVVLTLLTLPVAFLGVIVFELLKKRVKGVWPRLALTCFLGSLVFILLLAAFPWILVSLVYLAFFGL